MPSCGRPQPPHRRLALSRRLARREFQLRAPEALHPEAGGGQVRRLLHGRPHGRAEHADGGAQAQPHGRPRSSRSRCCRRWRSAPSASGSSPPARPPSTRPTTSRAASPRSITSATAAPAGTSSPPPTRTPRSTSAWTSTWSTASATARARVLRRRHRPVGQLGRRRLHPRRRERHLLRSRQDARARPQGQIPVGARPAQHRAPGAGLAGDRAGRRLRRRPPARRRDRRGGLHRAAEHARPAGVSTPT